MKLKKTLKTIMIILSQTNINEDLSMKTSFFEKLKIKILNNKKILLVPIILLILIVLGTLL